MYIFQHSLDTQINVKQTSLLTHVFLDEFSTACELSSDDLKCVKPQVYIHFNVYFFAFFPGIYSALQDHSTKGSPEFEGRCNHVSRIHELK